MKQTAKFCLGLGLLAVLLSTFEFKAVHGTNPEVVVVSPADAKGDFKSKCAKCHGDDGRARNMRGKHEHARDLTDAKWQDDVTDERLFNSISNGRSKMPAFKHKLGEDQINALVTYVRGLKR
jgi:mono/diheme cytochrome c family protein